MPDRSDPKNITETTTLAELRKQLRLLEVIALRIYPKPSDASIYPPVDSDGAVVVSVHHATGFYVGTGPTEAAAIEAAFAKIRRALLPEPLKQYIEDDP